MQGKITTQMISNQCFVPTKYIQVHVCPKPDCLGFRYNYLYSNDRPPFNQLIY